MNALGRTDERQPYHTDEEAGQSITASTCPHCDGAIRVNGGEIACLDCGVILKEYARTGRLPERPELAVTEFSGIEDLA